MNPGTRSRAAASKRPARDSSPPGPHVADTSLHDGAAASRSASDITDPSSDDLTVRRSRIVRVLTSTKFIRFMSVVGVFAIWEIVARFDLIGAGFFLTPPTEILVELWDWTASGDIIIHLQTSLYEIAVAYALAVAVGVVIGLLIGFNRLVRNLLEPTVAGLYSTPLLALTPLFIVWLGIGVTSKIAIIFFVVVFPVIINTAAGASEVEPSHIDVVRAFGGGKLDVITKVRLPSAVPYIIASMRIGISRAIVGVFVAELFGARAGIGYSISTAASAFNIPRMWAGVVVLSVMGILASGAMSRLERRIAPWKVHEVGDDN